ncbi:MAG: GNAT family N-acetyltransferase [Phyllobacterium sp.]
MEPLEDHPALLPLCARWNFEAWGRAAGRSMERTVDDFIGLLDPSGGQKVLVGFVSGLPVALSLLIDNDLESHLHLRPWLASLYVEPKMRLMGVGKVMVAATETAARRQGHDVLYLYTSETAYYRPLGWQTIEVLSGDNAGLSIMERRLTASA